MRSSSTLKALTLVATMLCALLVFAQVPVQPQQSTPAQAQTPNAQFTQGPVVEATTPTSATIAWSTNVASSTVIKYGTDPKNLSMTAEAPWGGLTHRVTISKLQPNTTYFFQVTSGEAQGTGTTLSSNISQFHTPAQ